MKRIITALLLSCTSAQAAHQDWVVTHQPDRFVDRIMMEAWADADKSQDRMMLYCDTESGFRVMFIPHRALIAEGPSQITLTIDSQKPVALNGAAFGDDDTDVVTVLDTGRIEGALADAHSIKAHFLGSSGDHGEDSFSFGDLAAQKKQLLQVCPLPKR